MKQVKSKITGDIGELDFDSKEGIFIVIYYDLHTKETIKDYYKNLEDLCEEWEDYEEPKEYWFVNDLDGEPMKCELRYCPVRDFAEWSVKRKKIGNYFGTKEEAEKAVEKLKAWKRLKDNGFKFEGVEKRGRHINFYQGRSYETDGQCQQAMKDLGLLFGGEE